MFVYGATYYNYIDIFKMFLNTNDTDDIASFKNVVSIIVGFLATLYWIAKIVDLTIEIKYKKKKRPIDDEIQELQKKNLKRGLKDDVF